MQRVAYEFMNFAHGGATRVGKGAQGGAVRAGAGQRRVSVPTASTW